MSGFARSRLADPDAFADEVRSTVASSLTESGGRYELDVVGHGLWGRPNYRGGEYESAWRAARTLAVRALVTRRALTC